MYDMQITAIEKRVWNAHDCKKEYAIHVIAKKEYGMHMITKKSMPYI